MMGLPALPGIGGSSQPSAASQQASQQAAQQGTIMQLMNNPMFKAMMSKYSAANNSQQGIPGQAQQTGQAPLTSQMSPLMSALIAQRMGVVK